MDEMIVSLDNELRVIGNNIPNINSGGCGQFAILLWDELFQLDMTAEAIVFTDKVPVWEIYHVALKWNGLYFDSDGVHENMAEYGFTIEERIPLDVLKAEAEDANLWSDKFDRSRTPQLKIALHALGSKLLTQKRETELLAVNF